MKNTEYENYSSTSHSYDQTRVPVGAEIILGCFAHSGISLKDQSILDAGCGTGNYLDYLKDKVGNLAGMDLNEGMLKQAGQKVVDFPNVSLKQGSLREIPFGDSAFDGISCNQVLHHLVDENRPEVAIEEMAMVMQEFYRVLKPGGMLVINTSTPTQISDGFWWAALIPEVIKRMQMRFFNLPTMQKMLEDSGFRIEGMTVPLTGILQGKNYLDTQAALTAAWRAGDSSFSLLDAKGIDHFEAQIRGMHESGKIDRFMQEREARRMEVGQSIFIYGVKE